MRESLEPAPEPEQAQEPAKPEPQPPAIKPRGPMGLGELCLLQQEPLYVTLRGALYDGYSPVVRMRQPTPGEWGQAGKTFPLIIKYANANQAWDDPGERADAERENGEYTRQMLLLAVTGFRVVRLDAEGTPLSPKLPDGRWDPAGFIDGRLVPDGATPGEGDLPLSLFDRGDNVSRLGDALIDDFNHGGLARLFDRVTFYSGRAGAVLGDG